MRSRRKGVPTVGLRVRHARPKTAPAAGNPPEKVHLRAPENVRTTAPRREADPQAPSGKRTALLEERVGPEAETNEGAVEVEIVKEVEVEVGIDGNGVQEEVVVEADGEAAQEAAETEDDAAAVGSAAAAEKDGLAV